MGQLLTPATVRALLDAHGLKPSRALGQNFLVDPNTARRIVRLAGGGERALAGRSVVEVGPGLGSLTLALADAGARVVALELDQHLVPVLAEVTSGLDVRVVHGNALSVDWSQLLGGTRTWSMVANLPYNVAVPVLLRALSDAPMIDDFLVMVQREVGERLAAAPGSRVYGSVSVNVAYACEAELVGSVPATVFMPRPKVESVLVRMRRRAQPPVHVDDPARMFVLVRAGFATRRKSLRQSLRRALGERTDAVLATAGIEPLTRAEMLGLDGWAALARADAEVP
ncbi:MAG TPA: 16S rRNA (adenine(1518)-N(6)/adenine(1519)-N(6))-dimethyltransferase RsmA [Acidimicrobiia bacterium]